MRTQTLTPALSREREREEHPVDHEPGSLPCEREREEHPVDHEPGSLPCEWEREEHPVDHEPGSLSCEREREQRPVDHGLSSLSRMRERARVRARELREGQTDAEALLWSKLRNRQLLGLKFRRQRPLGAYFADFACLEIGLIIELDGGQHGEQAALAYDNKREADLAAMGFQTLRFWNNQVLNETEAVMDKIRQTAESLTPTLSRIRERE
jgi:very-short-patch-repair endonuclease